MNMTNTSRILICLAALTAVACSQSLAGKRIVISPGHGYYWHSSLGWTTQRPLIDGLIEDIHTNEIVMDHLLPYLEGSGAQVISCRARTRTTEEHVIDNDDGFPAYQETGGWTTSGSTGWGGGTYRWTTTTPGGTATAQYRTTMANDDVFPVYVAYREGTNRSAAVRVEVTHAGGTSVRTIDQTTDGLRWLYVGSFPFRGGDEALVTIGNDSTSPGVVIADAVRIGDGMGSIVRGGTTSGEPRWRECSRYHAQYFGAPSSVWNPSSGPQDNSDDVTCRPHYAEWWGADLFLSLHTNAGGGSGTSTWIYNGGATAGSATFQNILHNQLIGDLQGLWSSSWQDDGQQQANFGEVRELVTMPGCLVELAFHDDIGGDIEAIHHPRFRRISGRAMYRAIATYFGATWVLDPPTALAMRNDGAGNLVLSWSPVFGATGYRVSLSPDGFAWDDGQTVTGSASLTLSGLGHGEMRFARVAVINAGGTGPDSEPVGARLAPGATSPLLLVQGFDRHDRYVKEHENLHDGIVVDGGVIDAVAAAGYPFDGCTNEAVINTLVPLGDYRCVGWILGEESTKDETFSTIEQSRVTLYLNAGGRLFFSGAEVGWDLDNLGTTADRAFYENVLGQDYVADDAGVYFTQAQATGPLAGLPSMQFDDGTLGSYDVDWPDVVAPSATGGGSIVLRYSTGTGAAVLRGDGRVLGIGFPIETIVDPAHRTALMERILAAMCPLRLSPAALVTPGTTPVDLFFTGLGGNTYVVGASFGAHPGTAVGDGRWFPLNVDPLTAFLFDPNQTVFADIVGSLDPTGHAQFQITLPAAVPSGIGFVMSAAVLDGLGVPLEIAPWVGFTTP